MSLTKMRQLGLEMSILEGQQSRQLSDLEVFSEMVVPSSILEIMRAFQEHGIARVLASPTVVTLNGRPASLCVGSTLVLPSTENVQPAGGPATVHVGTQLDVVPLVLDNEKVRLEMRLDWTGTNCPKCAQQEGTCALRQYKIDTAVEARLGETILLAQSAIDAGNCGQDEQVALLIMVTPNIVERSPLDAGSVRTIIGRGIQSGATLVGEVVVSEATTK